MKGELIKTVEVIHSNIKVKELNMVNVNNEPNETGAALGSMMAQYNAIIKAAK